MVTPERRTTKDTKQHLDSEKIHSHLFLRRALYCACAILNSPEETTMSARALPEIELQTATNDFHSLEEKIYKTIELLKSARDAKAIAERDAMRLREQLEEREEEVETLKGQLVGLRREREDVRGRVEKIIKQIDALTTDSSQ